MNLFGRPIAAWLSVSPRASVSRLTDRLAAWLPTDAKRGVRTATVVLTVALIGYVVRFGTNAPVMDEWDVVPDYVACKAEGRTAEWVFRRHNEHYYPAGRFAFACVMSATGNDFRGGMFASALVLGLSATIFVAVARKLRGQTTWGDLVIPALVLNWGAGFNVLMAYQLAFSLFVLTAAVALYVVVSDTGSRRGDVAAASIIFAFLASGGAGLACAAPFCGWVLVRSFALPRPLWWRFISAIFPACAAAAFGLWVVGSTQRAADPETYVTTTLDFFVATGQFLAMGFGTWVLNSFWWTPIGLAAAGYVSVAALTARAFVREPGERIRAIGLAAVALGVIGMAAGVAWGRGCGLVDRYSSQAAVGLIVVWLAFARYGPSMPRFLNAIGVVAAIALVVGNVESATRIGKIQRLFIRDLFKSIRDGLPMRFVADRHDGACIWYDNDRFYGRLDLFHRDGFEHFRDIKPDTPLVAIPTPWPAPVDLPATSHTEFHAAGPTGVSLPVPPAGLHVTGVAVEYETAVHNTFLEFRVVWTDRSGVTHKPNAYPAHYRGRYTVRFYIDGVVESARFEVACPADRVKIHRVEWLAAEGSRPD